MRKVRKSGQFRIKPGKPQTGIVGIYRPRNSMINKEALKGKTGGSSFENYTLDLMKLK